MEISGVIVFMRRRICQWEKEGLSWFYEVDSAAVSREEIGNGVYPPARRVLARYGVPCGDHRAKQMTMEDYRSFDLLIGMDWGNLSRMRRMTGGDPDGKVETFGIRGRNTSPLTNVEKLKKWLMSQPGKSYPVLLFRRDSLRFHNDIVFNHFQSLDIGRDILDDGEECF